MVVPGELMPGKEEIELNKGRKSVKLRAKNVGDRPIQIGSHFHFFEVNKALEFDREKAFGMRLDIPAGTAVRFEPGDEKEVDLVEVGGNKYVWGLNSLTQGSVVSKIVKEAAVKRAKEKGYGGMK